MAAVRNIRGLPSTEDLGKPFMDLFEFLEFFFEFQVFSLNYSYLILLFFSFPLVCSLEFAIDSQIKLELGNWTCVT